MPHRTFPFLLAACACLLLASSSAAELEVIWSEGITDESYWYLAAPFDGSALPSQITAGTFAIAYCRADTYDFKTGLPVASQPGICRPSASPSGSFGGIGYVYPDSNVVFNSSGASLTAKLNHEYYPAYGSSVHVTDTEIFVWGSRPLKDPSYGTACAFYAAAGQQSLQTGPCIDDYGIGEQAEDISLSRDGLVLLLSAGFKLAVYKRPSISSAFQQVFNFTFGVVVNFVALSADGRVIVCGCDDGLCGYTWSAAGVYNRVWSVASIDGFHFENAALGAGDDTHLLAVAVMNNEDSTQWCLRPCSSS